MKSYSSLCIWVYVLSIINQFSGLSAGDWRWVQNKMSLYQPTFFFFPPQCHPQKPPMSATPTMPCEEMWGITRAWDRDEMLWTTWRVISTQKLNQHICGVFMFTDRRKRAWAAPKNLKGSQLKTLGDTTKKQEDGNLKDKKIITKKQEIQRESVGTNDICCYSNCMFKKKKACGCENFWFLSHVVCPSTCIMRWVRRCFWLTEQ